jgi:hypothetical protein
MDTLACRLWTVAPALLGRWHSRTPSYLYSTLSDSYNAQFYAALQRYLKHIAT